MNKRKYFIVLASLAILGFLGAIWMVFFKKEPSLKYVEDPYINQIHQKDAIFGTGVVIPKSEEIAIEANQDRIVEKVYVREQQKVRKGDPLVQLYNKDLLNEISSRKAALEKAKNEWEKQKALPREEELSVQEALLSQARVEFQEADRQLHIAEELFASQAISQGELDQKKYIAQLEKAKFEYAKSQLAKLKAGAWQPEIEGAGYEIDYQIALLNAARQKFDESIIKAPIDATILKINVHPGESSLKNHSEPMIVLGDIDECYVEVSIDENQISNFSSENEAIGFFRGFNSTPIPLIFVRLKPLMVPKKNLTGNATENVDTKVLEAIYRFKNPEKCAFIGRLMDVFIPKSGNDVIGSGGQVE